MIYLIGVIALFVGFLIGMFVGSDLERKFNKCLRAGGSVIIGMNDLVHYVVLRNGKPVSYPVSIGEFDFISGKVSEHPTANTHGNDTSN